MADRAKFPVHRHEIMKGIEFHAPRLSVAALFDHNDLGLRFDEHSFYIDTPCGVLTIPKDGRSDAYRLREAVVEKTPGGDGMVNVLPVNSAEPKNAAMDVVWAFKEAWDNREPMNTVHIWGGSFITRANEYEDNGSYEHLDLQSTSHYYHILLTRREYGEFAHANPGLAYVECSLKCLPRKHYHGVHGCYKGAYVDGFPCAPPLRLLQAWNELPEFSRPVYKPKKTPKRVAVAPRVEEGAVEGIPSLAVKRAPLPEGGGAQILALIIDRRRPWSAIEETYRRPNAANWASLEGIIAPEAARKAVYKKWNRIYKRTFAPMLRDGGTPVASIVQRAWDEDPTPHKTMANYFVLRMVTGGPGPIHHDGIAA